MHFDPSGASRGQSAQSTARTNYNRLARWYDLLSGRAERRLADKDGQTAANIMNATVAKLREVGADELGARLAEAAGYGREGAVRLLERLEARRGFAPLTRGLARSKLSTACQIPGRLTIRAQGDEVAIDMGATAARSSRIWPKCPGLRIALRKSIPAAGSLTSKRAE